MSNKWITALKQFNKDKNEWCVPKKGTDGYDKTVKIMNEADKKKKTGSFLSNIIKSRLQENKYLKNVIKAEKLPDEHQKVLDMYPRPHRDKVVREKKTKEIKDEYKKIFNKDMDTDTHSVIVNKRMLKSRGYEAYFRHKRDEENKKNEDKGIKKRYTIEEIRQKFKQPQMFE